jgi:nucleoside-diphosphate-sugar epimerase
VTRQREAPPEQGGVSLGRQLAAKDDASLGPDLAPAEDAGVTITLELIVLDRLLRGEADDVAPVLGSITGADFVHHPDLARAVLAVWAAPAPVDVEARCRAVHAVMVDRGWHRSPGDAIDIVEVLTRAPVVSPERAISAAALLAERGCRHRARVALLEAERAIAAGSPPACVLAELIARAA